ncbi:DUF721 domain-containing protein [uncultured Amnibacterium sp.]|uniref:DUF721 domain-containing protein n=1 Tax=uncultured Amnibacterium sp. TaxID=1631851 RepID=UPI0035CB2A6C
MASDGSQFEQMPETVRVWSRLRAAFGGPRRPARSAPDLQGGSKPYEPGREPRPAGAVLDDVGGFLGWRTPLAQHDLMRAWVQIAGDDTARHGVVEGIQDGVLLVRCDSTAWATQLQLLRPQIAARIAAAHPEAGIVGIRFLGPNTASWNHGPRSVPGRGPRDTYG